MTETRADEPGRAAPRPAAPVLPAPPPPPAPPAVLARLAATLDPTPPPPPPPPPAPPAAAFGPVVRGPGALAAAPRRLPGAFPPPPPPPHAGAGAGGDTVAAAPIPRETPAIPAIPAIPAPSPAGHEHDPDAALTALADLVATTHLRRERWELALRASERNDPQACLDNCLAVLDLAPRDRAALLLAAQAARELRNWTRACELLGDVLDGDEPPGPADWDRIVAATVAREDDAVAASVRRLQLDPTAWHGEDAIVLVVMDGRAHVARRCGATRAEILSVASSGRPQHVGDVVAFDPRPVPEPAGSDGSGAAPLPSFLTFRALAVLQPGTRQVWFGRGEDPGFPWWTDAVAECAASGWVLRRAAPPSADHDGAVLGAVVVPAAVDPAQVQRRLDALVAPWPGEVRWSH